MDASLARMCRASCTIGDEGTIGDRSRDDRRRSEVEDRGVTMRHDDRHYASASPLTATRDNPMPIDALGRGAAREKVRVARALAGLPLIRDAMRRGCVSYAKVRAITRVATPATEQKLLDVALAGTASHVERIVRAWRRTDRVIAAEEAEARHRSRHLTTWIDDDGMLVLRGLLTPEAGAVVHRALEAAADQLFREAQAAPNAGGMTDDISWGPRRADALGRLAEVALAADLDAGTAGDRYQVVLHVYATAVSGDSAVTDVPFDGALEADSANPRFRGNLAAARLRRHRGLDDA